MTHLISLKKGRRPCAGSAMSLMFIALLFCPFLSFAQLALTCFISTDKPFYCPGDIATLTTKDAYIPGQAGTYSLWTEDLRTESQNCSGVGCTVLKEIEPQCSGDGVISCKVIERRGCGEEQWKVNTVQIKVLVTKTTTISISWAAKWLISEDIPCGEPERIFDERSFSGSIEIPVISQKKPELDPTSLTVNLGDQSKYFVATGNFLSNTKAFRWYTAECGNQTLVGDYRFYQGNQISHGVPANKVGKFNYKVQQGDDNCWSDFADATVTVKPCNMLRDGCEQEQVNFIESRSCDPAMQKRTDYHSYELEKKICSGCDINDVWQKYKADVHNQAIVLSDQIPYFTSLFPDAGGLPLPEFLTPEKQATQPITDCATLELPRLMSYLLRTALIAVPPAGNILKKVVEACSIMPYSFTDPIFLRVDENARCVTNYTKPGHALYPGKVTRCIVQECETVKILTFGEGTTLFQESECGKMLAGMNEWWGSRMFENVDNRAYDNIRLSGSPRKVVNAEQPAVPANSPFINKTWKVKSLHMEYDGVDSVYNFYMHNDTTNFFNLHSVILQFGIDGKTSGTNIDGDATQSTWSYDEATQMLTTDTTSVQLSSLTDVSFTATGIVPAMKDDQVVRARYTISFASDLTPLPVKFGSISASAVQCRVKLDWEMFTDDPGAVTVVERSTGDGWESIGGPAPTQFENQLQKFHFVDQTPRDGNNVYRIRTLERNGSVTYSRIVNAVNNCGRSMIIAYPNPVNDQLKLQVPVAFAQSRITIMNVQGQVKYSGKILAGENHFNFGLYSPGTYFIRITKDNKTVYRHTLIKN